jgi:Spy/CpxP family protein refolding chaperone
VWRRVNADEAPGARDRGGRLAKLAERAGLTPDQVEKISTALTQTRETAPLDPKEFETQVQAFGTAFAADTFDARTLAPAADASSHVARSGAGRMARFYEAAAPVLTPEQRTKVAEHLRDHLAEPQTSSGT